MTRSPPLNDPPRITRELPGVVFAMDYLIAQNEVVAGVRTSSPYDVRGKRVVILGGGDTGSD